MSVPPHLYLHMLGFPMRDKVTGFAGVATSISFDLYGCIQVAILPPVTENGEAREGRWFDVARVARVATSGGRVMEPPAAWTSDRGSAEKPFAGWRG